MMKFNITDECGFSCWVDWSGLEISLDHHVTYDGASLVAVASQPCALPAEFWDWAEDRDMAASEAAYERECSRFYGGDGPVTQQEQYLAAAAMKREVG